MLDKTEENDQKVTPRIEPERVASEARLTDVERRLLALAGVEDESQIEQAEVKVNLWGWENYVTSELRQMWGDLPLAAKAVARIYCEWLMAVDCRDDF